MAGISFVRVVDAGPGWNQVEASDGNVYTFTGTYAWRSNNPGNIEYGPFAQAHGAIGHGAPTTGHPNGFAIFPTPEAGNDARTALIFGPSYSSKSIEKGIAAWAPPGENDSAGYAQRLASAAGVPVTTKLGDLTPDQRQRLLTAQHSVENNTPGTIKGADGKPVAPEVAQQFAAARLPAANVPHANPINMGNDTGAGADWRKFTGDLNVPLPFSGPLVPAKSPALQAAFDRLGKAVATSGGGNTSTPSLVKLASDTLKLPSGKTIAAGTYPASDGSHKILVTDDGRGNAVITKITNPGEIPGVIDPLHEGNSVAGHMIRNAIQDTVKKAAPNVSNVIGNATQAVQQKASEVGNSLGSTASNLGGNVMGFFGNFLNPGSGSKTASTAPVRSDVAEARAEQAAMRNYRPAALTATVKPAVVKPAAVGSLIASGAALRVGTTASGSASLKPAPKVGGMGAIGASVAGGVGSTIKTAPVVARPAVQPTVSLAQLQAQQKAAQAAAAAAAARAAAPPPAPAPAPVYQPPQQTYQQAQQDLHDSGMIDSFGMVTGSGGHSMWGSH